MKNHLKYKVKSSVKKAKAGTKTTGRVVFGVGLLVAIWAWWGLLRARAQTTGRAHHHLARRWSWYDSWHQHKYHKHAHYSALVVFLLAMALNAGIFRTVLASDVFYTWDFSVPGNYTIGSDAEVSGTSVRLRAQNYSTDGNTKGLYHLDDGSGATLSDSSGNSNNAPASGSPAWGTGNLNGGLGFNGTSQYAAAPDSASLSITGSNTLESWVKFSSPFSAGSSQYRQTILDKGKYQLYYDNETGKVTYELENSGSTNWTQQAGRDLLAGNGAKVKRSWDENGKQNVNATVKMGSNIYTALGGSTNDAEVWEYNTSSGVWTQIAGDGINSSWDNEISSNAYEAVLSLATNGSNVLYAGLGTGTNDGDVWRYKDGSWAKIGGDGINSGWAGNAFNGVYSLAASGTTVWAGLGTGGDMGQVWVCTNCETTPSWNGSRLGGYSGGVTRGWGTGFEAVRSMTIIGGNPVVGLGDNAVTDGRVYHCTASCTSPGSATWVQRGGTNAGSWTNAEQVLSLASNGNNLYVGTGITANADANVRTCDVSTTCTDSAGWTSLGSAAQWGTTKLGVYSISNNGGTLYVGVGSASAGDDEVWRYDGAWTKVGGDGVFSGWNATHTYARSVLVDGTTVYAGLSSTAEAYTWRCTSCNNGSASWGSNRIGGKYVNKSWGQFNFDSIESSTTAGGKLYVGTGNNTAGDATVWEQDPATGYWSVVGGQGINSSWAIDTYESVWAMTNYKNKLYVGLGSTAGEAEVWRFDNPGWTKVADGSPSVGSSWSTTYEAVYSLGVANGKLYAGLGNSSGDAEVWECGGCEGGSPNWGTTAKGGFGTGNWGTTPHSAVSSMATYRGSLFVGLGNNGAGYAEVWRYSGSGTAWTRVGGDGVNSSWVDSKYEDVPNLVVWNDKLVAGLGSTGSGTPNNDAEVWACTGCEQGGSPTWAQIGGDSTGADNLGWLDANNYDRVRSMAVYNGDLYAGLGLSQGDGEVWRYNGTTWTQVGGDGANDSWLDSTVEDVSAMVVHRGKLYAGLGNTGNSDAMVWSYGDNGYLQSSTTSQDTNWHHVAARYNGTTMELLVDGASVGTATKSLTMSDGPHDLLIGKSHGGFDNGRSQGFFEGSLDEVRISNSNRNSFQTLPYSTSAVTVNLNSAAYLNGIKSWDAFAASETTAGGSINYRLSNDGGTTWKYWNGSAWATSSSTSQVNPKATINSNISTFPVTLGGGILWQAVLQGDGTQQVQLNSVSLDATADVTPPETNATSVVMYKSNGGTSVSSNGWTNGSSPYFTWTAGADAGAGIKGYCLYLGQTSGSDPTSTKGMLGTSPISTAGTNCHFIVPSNSVDLATAGYLASALATSNSPYYLYVAALDNAGNAVSSTTTEFHFRFDNDLPTNPAYVTAPSGFINTKQATLSWQTVGGDAPSDGNSGLAGVQYRIGPSSPWYGELHSGTQDITDLLTNDGSYTTQAVPDYDNIAEGINTIYFRTWDNAGNVTTSYTTAALKVNTSGAPSSPQNVTPTPATNTSNAFAFSWQKPASFVGNPDGSTLTYCWTVNVVPSSGNCNWTGGGVTSLGSGPYATQPGTNTFYVVARDESSNVNYDTYASATFTANTSAPGSPVNPDVVDASIKATSNWRLALTWESPTDPGSGVANYKIYRSTNNISFSVVATTTATSLVDVGLSQQDYYYYVKACDSANNCGVASSTVTKYPTGRYTAAASLTANPKTSDISTRKATISWSTDRASDSKIQLGTKAGVYANDEVSNSNQVTAHEINLTNLAAGTTYFFRVKWTDEDGNTGTSSEYSFVTSPAPVVKEVATKKINLTSATIDFTSKGATKVKIYYGKSESFGGTKIINTSIAESNYSTELAGLEDGSKYYYKIDTFDDDGNEYEGNIFSFTTPQRPKIANLKFEPITGEPTSTQRITWSTNVAANSAVTYGVVGSGGSDITSAELKTEHEIIIRDLTDNSEYFLVAQSRDADGNLATSDRQTFHTALDTRPPKIKDLTVESTIRGTGSEARGQLIVSWNTDEPSTSQVAYGEGSTGTTTTSQTTEDANKTTEHTVVISDLSTAKVYNVSALSRDKASNQAKSEPQSAIIGRASESVLSIIFNTMQKIFGFLGK